VGFLPKERWHIWEITAKTGRTKQLTEGEVYDEQGPCWSPDGREIAFCSNRSQDPDFDPDAIDLFVMGVEDRNLRKIETPPGPKASPRYSPDGKWLAYYGREGKGQWWKQTCLWVVPADGSGRAENLTEEFDFNVSSWTINDMGGSPPMMPPTWSNDGKTLYFQVAHHGNTVLKSISFHGDERAPQTVIGDKGVVGSFNFNTDQGKLAYFRADMADPGQVWIRNTATGHSRMLTQVNKKWKRCGSKGARTMICMDGFSNPLVSMKRGCIPLFCKFTGVPWYSMAISSCTSFTIWPPMDTSCIFAILGGAKGTAKNTPRLSPTIGGLRITRIS
jgi:Tol biopolymer transport system component